jgi:hypothetical protein
MQESRGLRRVTLAMLGVVAACSGASTSDFFGPGGGGAIGADSGSGGDATVGGPGETKGDGGGTRKDASTSDAAPKADASAVDAQTADVNTGPVDPGVFCGVDTSDARKYCPVSSQYCCITDNGSELTFTCKTKSGPSCAGLQVPCSDQRDCDGKICCATYDNVNGGYSEVACRDTCDKDTLTETEFRLCDHDAPADECEAIGKSCQESSAVPGWYVCK